MVPRHWRNQANEGRRWPNWGRVRTNGSSSTGQGANDIEEISLHAVELTILEDQLDMLRSAYQNVAPIPPDIGLWAGWKHLEGVKLVGVANPAGA